jgi:hypothetical protein
MAKTCNCPDDLFDGESCSDCTAIIDAAEEMVMRESKLIMEGDFEGIAERYSITYLVKMSFSLAPVTIARKDEPRLNRIFKGLEDMEQIINLITSGKIEV